ncbi:hypothetical protein BGX27_008148 [Mortierella sp. AM989]|nr:hypothetical protein BGX27_008148 [Mortierella sp. AM989]
MRIPYISGLAFIAGICLLLFTATTVGAVPDTVMDTCYHTGCSAVFTLLDPCGGGATNASLQQDFIYTPTASLGGCECNSYFYNYFSSCLSCIASQGDSSPEIQDQPGWVDNCVSYGFNFSATPVTTPTNNGNNRNSNSDGGLSKGAIAGIVVGAVVLITLIIVGAWFCLKGRKGKQGKTKLFEKPGASSIGAAVGATAAATTAGATSTSASHYHNQDYPTTFDQQDNYAGLEDSNTQHIQGQPFTPQHTDYPTQQQFHSGHRNEGYYGMNDHDTMMMRQLDHSTSRDNVYVPPPPHLASTPSTATVSGGNDTYSAVSRPQDSLPQSLRSKPKGWDSQNQNQHEFSSSLPMGQSLHNDKAEFEEGEELEPPRSRNRYANDREEFTARRSMTPPRANMQSYRDEFTRPSFEREPRRSGSDIGSISGLNMARGMDSGSNNNFTNYDQPSDDPYTVRGSQGSPESARRRARAAELFSAESNRR